MPRLTRKSAFTRAPNTVASFPEFPDFSAEFAALPGGQQTNVRFQSWWDEVRQRFGQDQQAEGIFNRRISASVDGLEASVTETASVVADQEGYLEASWTIRAAAGNVVTGMKLFSASGPDTEISIISFQADVFQVNTATGGNKQIFSATATEVLFGDVLTVDLANAQLYIGAGNFGNADTPFYVDELAFFSLGEYLTFDTSQLTIGNAYIDTDGSIVLGTANDVLILTAADPTYRIWAGNATAGSAAFSVTKAGALFATAATISGASVFSGTVNIGTGNSNFLVNSSQLSYGTRFTMFDGTGSGGPILDLRAGDIAVNSWYFNVTSSSATDTSVALVRNAIGVPFSFRATNTYFALDGLSTLPSSASFYYDFATNGLTMSGGVTAGSFSGDGSALTSLNASNLSSGTVPDARIGTSNTATADVPIVGYWPINGIKLAIIA